MKGGLPYVDAICSLYSHSNLCCRCKRTGLFGSCSSGDDKKQCIYDSPAGKTDANAAGSSGSSAYSGTAADSAHTAADAAPAVPASGQTADAAASSGIAASSSQARSAADSAETTVAEPTSAYIASADAGDSGTASHSADAAADAASASTAAAMRLEGGDIICYVKASHCQPTGDAERLFVILAEPLILRSQLEKTVKFIKIH